MQRCILHLETVSLCRGLEYQMWSVAAACIHIEYICASTLCTSSVGKFKFRHSILQRHTRAHTHICECEKICLLFIVCIASHLIRLWLLYGYILINRARLLVSIFYLSPVHFSAPAQSFISLSFNLHSDIDEQD